MKNKHEVHSHEKDCCHTEAKGYNNAYVKKIWQNLNNYKPLIVIIIFCILISLAQIHPFDHQKFMYSFMGYFFIFLSIFKFFDLKGFVEGFSTYDLITKQFLAYGYIYPFIEFCLGIAYLAQFNLFLVNCLTVVVMFGSGVGILKSILSGQKIKCACLGTMLNVPLSVVSVLENFGMGTMAFYKLFFFF